jgi:hypothetical protein
MFRRGLQVFDKRGGLVQGFLNLWVQYLIEVFGGAYKRLVKRVVEGVGDKIPICWVQYVKEVFGDGLQIATISCMDTI